MRRHSAGASTRSAPTAAVHHALLTGDTESQELLRVQASGIPVMYKPVDTQELKALLHRLSQLRRPGDDASGAKVSDPTPAAPSHLS